MLEGKMLMLLGVAQVFRLKYSKIEAKYKTDFAIVLTSVLSTIYLFIVSLNFWKEK